MCTKLFIFDFFPSISEYSVKNYLCNCYGIHYSLKSNSRFLFGHESELYRVVGGIAVREFFLQFTVGSFPLSAFPGYFYASNPEEE